MTATTATAPDEADPTAGRIRDVPDVPPGLLPANTLGHALAAVRKRRKDKVASGFNSAV